MHSISRSLTRSGLLAAAVSAACTLIAVPIQTHAVEVEGAAARIEIADAASRFDEVYEFYSRNQFQSIWTGDSEESERRRAALFAALDLAFEHGIPMGAARKAMLVALFARVGGPNEAARADVEFSRTYLEFARELNSGYLDPQAIDKNIAPTRNELVADQLLDGILGSDPEGFLASLAPQSAEYRRLLELHAEIRGVVQSGGWGPTVEAERLEFGDSGAAVVALRNRLIRMGYLLRTADAEYGGALVFAVRRFQLDHGLDPDGIAGPRTLRAVNVEPAERLGQVLASLERARWMNKPLGKRHVLVNLADFKAAVVDDGRSVFTSRVVIGQNTRRLRTPEFSDVMTHLTVNPTWYVPRSITVREILPQLQENPNAEKEIQIYDPETGTVDRSELNFAEFSASNFPFRMRQPPGPTNALGRVKFMFPNHYNIYMHDTPFRDLFQKEVRAFSHGCIRVQKAHEFARFLLSEQLSPAFDFFENLIESGTEVQVNFDYPLPVHVTYRTAWMEPDGRVNFRNDIYGRDKAIYNALVESGLGAAALSS